jgi:hypothetical protein
MSIKSGKRLYLFDFDNTLVNTAEIIRKHGYEYKFEYLRFYPRMLAYYRERQRRGHVCIVLTKRSHKSKGDIQAMFSRHGLRCIVVTVKAHWLKAFFVIIACTRWKVVLLDDMYCGEEWNTKKKLFFPFVIVPQRASIISHEKLFSIR